MPNTVVRQQRVVLATILEDSHQPPGPDSKEQLQDLGSKDQLNDCSFTVLNKIGQGGYGHVFIVEKNQGIDKKDIYAMKVINKSKVCRKPKEVEYIRTERNIMAMFRHPFIIGLNYAFQTTKQLFYVMDFAPGGELFNRLSIQGAFDEETVRFYASEIICALEFLHGHNIVYRDLKPDNILIDRQGHVKLADFGLSKVLPVVSPWATDAEFTDCLGNNGCSDYRSESLDDTFRLPIRSSTRSCCGTLVYMAPEVIEKNPYGKAADVWSLGVVIYDMMVGKPPFYASNHHNNGKSKKATAGSSCAGGSTSNINRSATKYNILHCNYKIPANIGSTSKGLINALLQLNVENRLGGYDADVAAIKNHPFFENINWTQAAERLLVPPFVPSLQSVTDVSNFDDKHTEDSQDAGALIQANFAKSTESDEYPYIENFDFILPELSCNKQ